MCGWPDSKQCLIFCETYLYLILLQEDEEEESENEEDAGKGKFGCVWTSTIENSSSQR